MIEPAPTRPTEGCCGTCGFLAKRVKPEPASGVRSHSGFYEVEQEQRDHPLKLFPFMPNGSGMKTGELVCFRRAADLQDEMGVAFSEHRNEPNPQDAAAYAVICRARNCEHWCQYEPGISPRDHLAELKARDLEASRREFQQSLAAHEARQTARDRRADRRLTKAAIWLGSIIGLAQLLTMTSDSIGYRWWLAAWRWLSGLCR